jgi:uncharacterized protein
VEENHHGRLESAQGPQGDYFDAVRGKESDMISPDLLEILRCPMDPTRTARLTLDKDHLVCERCALIFAIKDGFPILIVEEAELPPGYQNLDQLPCQQEKKGD